ncbi:MAG TPA: hypothetical protein VLZ81_11450, partial [Blastocatellia bacterium]|nr:hypothetical protein [Blastocatellia bacterium]
MNAKLLTTWLTAVLLISQISLLNVDARAALGAGARMAACGSRTASAQNAPQSPEFYKLAEEGNQALYDLDFQAAHDRFQRMADLCPDCPAPYVYLAVCIWLDTLNKARRLSPSLFSTTYFYAQGSQSDKLDAAADQQFNDLIDRATTTSAELLKKNPKDAQALYYQAGSLGVRAAYNGTVRRSFRKAIGDANKAAEIQAKVLKLDPQYYDAYLSIGLYEYIIGSLPFFWRLMARLAGLGGGSREGGIERLETVIAKGRLASDDARLFLLAIYNREGNLDKSLGLAEYLKAKYPRNYLLAI